MKSGYSGTPAYDNITKLKATLHIDKEAFPSLDSTRLLNLRRVRNTVSHAAELTCINVYVRHIYIYMPTLQGLLGYLFKTDDEVQCATTEPALTLSVEM